MGFLKFLKRERKKDEFEDLDLPPEPPPLEGFEEELPKAPETDIAEIGKISAPEQFDFPEEEKSTEASTYTGKEEQEQELMPELGFPELDEKISSPEVAPEVQTAEEPETALPMGGFEEESPLIEEHEEEPHPVMGHKPARRLFAPERRLHRELPISKTIYIRVDKFKVVLGSINMVKSDLRKSDEVLAKLENIKLSKDKSFEKMRTTLNDLQKKLIFVDKTLFKGD